MLGKLRYVDGSMPLGQKSYALAAIDILRNNGEVSGAVLYKEVCRDVHDSQAKKKRDKKSRQNRFRRTMQGLQERGIVEGTQYGLAPDREKKYKLSDKAETRLARSPIKTKLNYLKALDL